MCKQHGNQERLRNRRAKLRAEKANRKRETLAHLLGISELPTPEELRLDVAWEARRGIANFIGCRECGDFLKTPLSQAKGGHIAVKHPHLSVEKYQELYPFARLMSLSQSAQSHGNSVEEFVKNFADAYFTPAEIAEGRLDGGWEVRNGISPAMCRLCGRKIRSHQGLLPHLRHQHPHTSLQEYLTRWPGVPRGGNAARIRNNDLRNQARNRRIADAKLKVRGLEQQLESAKAEVRRLKDQEQGQESKIGILVNDAIPQFERLFSTAEIKHNPRLLLDNWRHPDFTWDEIRAAREAYMGRSAKAKWPTLAARWFVALSENYDIATVRKYHNRYLSAA